MAIEYAVIPAPATIGLVSSTKNGLMSSVDKIKLDGLDYGSSAYPILISTSLPVSSTTEIARIASSALASFTFFVDFDDASGGMHFQVNAKIINDELDYVRSNFLGGLSHIDITLVEDGTDVVMHATNSSGTNIVEAKVKII